MQTRSELIPAVIAAADARRLEFTYDYLGRRVGKLVRSGWNGSTYATQLSDTRFVYSGWNLIAEYRLANNEGFGSLSRSFTWGLDLSGSLQGAGGVGGLLMQRQVDISTDFVFAYDGNGNLVSALNRSTGALVGVWEYTPFGEKLAAYGSHADNVPFGFSTKYTDKETGLVYYGRRYYDPKTGRWLSRDPKEELGGLNLYGFLASNGVNRWDLLGMYDGFLGCGWCGGDGSFQAALNAQSDAFAAAVQAEGQTLIAVGQAFATATLDNWSTINGDISEMCSATAAGILATSADTASAAAATSVTNAVSETVTALAATNAGPASVTTSFGDEFLSTVGVVPPTPSASAGGPPDGTPAPINNNQPTAADFAAAYDRQAAINASLSTTPSLTIEQKDTLAVIADAAGPIAIAGGAVALGGFALSAAPVVASGVRSGITVFNSAVNYLAVTGGGPASTLGPAVGTTSFEQAVIATGALAATATPYVIQAQNVVLQNPAVVSKVVNNVIELADQMIPGPPSPFNTMGGGIGFVLNNGEKATQGYILIGNQFATPSTSNPSVPTK